MKSKFLTSDAVRACLAVAIVLLLMIIVIVPMFVSLPEANTKFLDIVLGSTLPLIAVVVGYYFGSSDGSKVKTDAMAAEMEREDRPPGL